MISSTGKQATVMTVLNIYFRVGRMHRIGQKVNGVKQLLAISFFSPSQNNIAFSKSQDEITFAMNTINVEQPSASEHMAKFFCTDIFPFVSPMPGDNATEYIKKYYQKAKDRINLKASEGKYSKKKKNENLVEQFENIQISDVNSISYSPGIIDQNCSLKSTHQVMKTPDGYYYDAHLNFTNIQNNNNKYYNMQILERREQGPNGLEISVWWSAGRVGFTGHSGLETFDDNVQGAVDFFRKKFRHKTRNNWEDRHQFVEYPGMYVWIEKENETVEGFEEIQPCRLQEKVKKLIEMISDIEAMKICVKGWHYDINQCRLGQ